MSYDAFILKHFKGRRMATQIYVNLPVKDLQRSMKFFRQVGFSFNMRFTNEDAACMVIADNIYVVLLAEKFFRSFTKKEIPDATKGSEVIVAISAESRKQVDDLVNNATIAGATSLSQKQDHGWMYCRGFQDLDGHLWETMYLDPAGPKLTL